MPFSRSEREIVDFVEQQWFLNQHVPSAEAISKYLGLSPTIVARFMDSDPFRNAAIARGINLLGSESRGLSAQQHLVINTLLDFQDTRSQKKKLADLKINSQTYQGWLRDPAFQTYLTQRAEKLLPDITADAHLALVDNVRRGDLGSIKLYYEMTGRWSSKTVGELNVEFLMMKVLETIQKHVTDQATLEAIGDDLMGLGAIAPQQPVARPAITNTGAFDL